jgi:hypothetical protein
VESDKKSVSGGNQNQILMDPNLVFDRDQDRDEFFLIKV